MKTNSCKMCRTPGKTVFVFSTNVLISADSKAILANLERAFPSHRINFDLEDCDKILRIEGKKINPDTIDVILQQHNHNCCLLAAIEST